MVDLTGGLQTALFVRLSAAVTLAGVGQHVDENPIFPLVVIGEDLVEDLGDKTDRFERHTVTIATLYIGGSKVTMRQIQEQVRAALVGQPLVAAGCQFSSPRPVIGEDQLLENGDTYVGQQKFEIYAQPAG